MRKLRLTVLASALLVAPLLLAQGPQTAFPSEGSDAPVDWAETMPDALKRAGALDGGRLLVEIRDARCSECERVEKLLYPSASFRAFLKDKVPVRLLRGTPDADRLYARYRLRTSPAWLVLSTDLMLCGKLEGDTNQSTWIQSFFESEKAWAAFLRAVEEEKASPADPARTFAVGEEAYRRYGDVMAERRFRKLSDDDAAPAELRAKSLAYLATFALEASRFDDASRTLERVLATTKDPALQERAELRLADVEIGRGDHPKAAARLKAFLEKHPQSPLKPQAEGLLRLLDSPRP
ncbi:MAG: tetratricopeptide repeat protein [Thermoanaerobaculia bacterium]|jgi:tetratricopeptide (TPR) repeat protein|nr:tetratricopeptide repeat protein [Thermoanaerobaculia bacterium]